MTVFATNGRGSGPSVSEIVYAEEDSEFYHIQILRIKKREYRDGIKRKETGVVHNVCMVHEDSYRAAGLLGLSVCPSVCPSAH